jgi:hypothetical protein
MRQLYVSVACGYQGKQQACSARSRRWAQGDSSLGNEKLGGGELAVEVISGGELLVGANSPNPSAVDNQYPVGAGDGGQPVGDH